MTAEDVNAAATQALHRKMQMIEEVFLRAIAEGWPKFYFWIEQSPPDSALTFSMAMHCGPTAPDGIEHEVYDTAECEARFDTARAVRERTP